MSSLVMKNKFAIVRLWDGVKNAEFEVTERFLKTAKTLGKEVVLIDDNGYYIDDKNKELRHSDVDFVLHLHFSTPKTYDAFSFAGLWNPINFYFDWGYRYSTDNIISHDDYLSCGSKVADDHIKRMLINDKSKPDPKLKLYHSLSEPIIEPQLRNDRKAFYIGINWERVSGNSGRFDGIFKALDSSGKIKIFGPKLFAGVKVWGGFKCYQRELPFDGESVIKEISKQGISLVFSSDAHKQSSIMSSRLFESAAAGALIISDSHPFVQKHFKDSVLYVDTTQDTKSTAAQIEKHIDWANNNPTEALNLAKQSQQIFKDNFLLSSCISNIYKSLEGRKNEIQQKYLASTNKYKVDLFHFTQDNLADTTKFIDMISDQVYPNFEIKFLFSQYASTELIDEILTYAKKLNLNSTKEIINIRVSSKSTAVKSRPTFGSILRTVYQNASPDNTLVMLCENDSTLFHDHISSLVRKFEDQDDIAFAFSNCLLKSVDNSKKEFRHLSQFNPHDIGQYRCVENMLYNARSLIEIPSCLSDYLEQLFALFLAGNKSNYASTNKATLVKNLNFKHTCFSEYSRDQEAFMLSDTQVVDFKSKVLTSSPRYSEDELNSIFKNQSINIRPRLMLKGELHRLKSRLLNSFNKRVYKLKSLFTNLLN